MWYTILLEDWRQFIKERCGSDAAVAERKLLAWQLEMQEMTRTFAKDNAMNHLLYMCRAIRSLEHDTELAEGRVSDPKKTKSQSKPKKAADEDDYTDTRKTAKTGRKSKCPFDLAEVAVRYAVCESTGVLLTPHSKRRHCQSPRKRTPPSTSWFGLTMRLARRSVMTRLWTSRGK